MLYFIIHVKNAIALLFTRTFGVIRDFLGISKIENKILYVQHKSHFYILWIKLITACKIEFLCFCLKQAEMFNSAMSEID